MAEYSQKWHNGTSRTRSTETSDGLVAIQAQLNNLGREINKVNEKVYDAQVGCEQCKSPHYTKDCPFKEEGKTLEEAYYTQFGAPFQGGGYRATTLGFYQRNNVNPSFIPDTPYWITPICRIYWTEAYTAIRDKTNDNSVSKSFEWLLLKEKEPGSFTLPCFINNVCFDNALADLEASVSVMPLSTYLNLGLDELAHTRLIVELADRTVKYLKGIAENVLVGIERMELDLEARLMRETLVLNRSLDPFFEDYIELNDLNVPLELRRDQVDDLLPTIEEGEVIEEFRARNDARMDKLEYNGNNVVGALMNIPIFVGNFSIITDFAVLEDMDAYRDKGMGDVIFGELFLIEVGINARWFEGIVGSLFE
ncbi:hypothetical protein Tco_0917805 [Tanacetum coccineum]